MNTNIDVNLRPQQAPTPSSNKLSSDLITASSAKPLPLPEPSKEDTVKLTASAHALNKAQGESDTAPVDAKKVHQLSAAIASGSFSVDAKRVAGKMMAFEHQIHRAR